MEDLAVRAEHGDFDFRTAEIDANPRSHGCGALPPRPWRLGRRILLRSGWDARRTWRLVSGSHPQRLAILPVMPNRLAAEKSPYLLQHAENPVDWYPWGEEAFARARGEDKPIFLSIGYSTCHWCHVMEHESF